MTPEERPSQGPRPLKNKTNNLLRRSETPEGQKDQAQGGHPGPEKAPRDQKVKTETHQKSSQNREAPQGALKNTYNLEILISPTLHTL